MTQNLSSYRIFYFVAKYGNISRAAKELYISQPAISKSIRKLEESLGTTLFTRSSKGVTLTEEGRLLYQHVDSAFRILETGEDELLRNQELGVGHLKIGVSNTLCKYLLLPYLKDFVQKHPHMNISISCQSSKETISLIEDGALDIGFTAMPVNHPALVYDAACDIEDTFVAAPSYLAKLDAKGVKEKDYFYRSSLMLLNKENMTRKHVDEYFARNGIEISDEIIEVSSMDLLIDFARIGLGVAAVIRQSVEKELADGTLVEVKLPYPIKKRSVGFTYKNIGKLTKAQSEFIKFYKQR